MTVFPESKHLADYPFIEAGLPLHISLNEIRGRFPAHRHDFLEFSLVIGGEGTETVNGRTHAMEPGVFTFLLPYQVHELCALPGGSLRLFNCMFDLSLLLPAFREQDSLSALLFSEAEQAPHVKLNGEERSRMEALVREMLEEYRGGGVGRDFLLRLKLAEVLLRLQRARAGKGGALPDSAGMVSSGGADVWRVIHYIHSHYREELQLGTLAERFGYRPSQLSEAIKRQAGVPFSKLVQEVRLRHACSLLASTDMRTLDIALEAGFGSFQTFSRVFREHKGMTPGDYRRLAGRPQ
ncbi:AraC family transcriptional regulator [Paenibacillus sp. S-38]|uniref:AraC family transcriptional regulator n=1 Tax=Paenibacillus sp. S-38 TaxID=3416710 RepID=UPI003CF15A00